MGMQNFSAPPARNQAKAAVIPGEIKLPSPSKSMGLNEGKAPVAKDPSTAGFSGGGLIAGKIKV